MLLNIFRRRGVRPSQLAVPQYTPPSSTHQQIMNDLMDAGATPGEAIQLVAKSATRGWKSAKGNRTRGDLHEAELNQIDGGGLRS